MSISSDFTIYKASVHSVSATGIVSVVIPALSGSGTIQMPSLPIGTIAPTPGQYIMVAVNHDRTVFDWIIGPAYDVSGGGVDGLLTHIEDLTPHPAYDDLPSLTLIFENGLV